MKQTRVTSSNVALALTAACLTLVSGLRAADQATPQPVQPPGPPVAGTAPIPAPAVAPAVPPAHQLSASEIVTAYHNSLVFVTGKEASGSGFIASMNGRNYLVTNAHVAAGINDAAFKSLDGTVVQGGAASVAVGHDIFCMQMPAGGKPLEIMQGVDANAAIGDDVVVLGNAEGQGVINTITGKITGIGPDLVEIDAQFVPGNSGSPIIHLKTGKVIGVATYIVTTFASTAPAKDGSGGDETPAPNKKGKKKKKENTPDPTPSQVIRRFGYRLDDAKTWQAVNWQTFYAQAAVMKNIETLTADLDDFFRDLYEHKGGVTPGRHTNPVIKSRIDQWLENKATSHSSSDEAWEDKNFISFLEISCQSDIAAAQRQLTYELADQKQTRDAMAKAFEEIIKGLQN